MQKEDLFAPFAEQLGFLLPAAARSDCDLHIALSGGVDSVVLLHLAARLREKQPDLTLHAHHVNHGLSDCALSWQDFCRQLCADLAIDFTCSAVHLAKTKRTSIEALAREKRYACLRQSLTDNSYLLTAHHQDDQLETVLLALKRGAGNTGLQGIRSKQKLKQGYLIRPLLDFSRQQLEQYARAFNLRWINDESNADQTFDRNYIRHTVSPILKARWPSIAKTVARSAAICQEQQQLLDEIAAFDGVACMSTRLNQQALSIKKLERLSVARRNNVLRYWFKANQLNYPSLKQLSAVWTDMVLAGDDALPKMAFQDLTLRRYREHLYVVRGAESADLCTEPFIWSGESHISLLDGRINLCFTRLNVLENMSKALRVRPDSEIKICFRPHLPNRLSCTPTGRMGSRSIKKLLHEYHVPPWLRDSVPFIFIDGVLCEALGVWQCQTLPTDADGDYLMVSFV